YIRFFCTLSLHDALPIFGDTTGIGLIYQPAWLPEFSMSVDYYNIEISDAILTIGDQEVVDRCFEGNATLCNSIQRGDDGRIAMRSEEHTSELQSRESLVC